MAYGYIKVAKPTIAHGAMLQALKYTVTKEKKTFVNKKRGRHEALAFKVECQGFITDDVDATSAETLIAAIREAVQNKNLFLYTTKFVISPIAKPITGLAACAILDKVRKGLSCLVTHSDETLNREVIKAADPTDILGALGLDVEDL